MAELCEANSEPFDSIKCEMFVINVAFTCYSNKNAFHPINSVCIAKGYRLDGRGSVPGKGKRFFSTPQSPDQIWGAGSGFHPVSYRMGTLGSFPRGKAAGV
jgi:hypothetical protein